MSDIAARPFLKWAGGKHALLEQLRPLYPKKVRRYFEPFLGAGAVFFDVASRFRLRRAVLSDRNNELVVTWKAIQRDLDGVIAALEKHAARHSKEHYYATRASTPRSDAAIAARFIYLNRTCFNGLYRVNRSGRFNVPMGSYKAPRILDVEGLRAVSRALGGSDKGQDRVVIGQQLYGGELGGLDFEETLTVTKRGDFVYLDPPYQPVSDTANFTSFTARPFSESDQRRLAYVYRDLANRDVQVMLSQSDTPLVRELYRGYEMVQISARRSINSAADRRGPVRELAILSYERPATARTSTPRAARRGHAPSK